jgi:hypothetical protein
MWSLRRPRSNSGDLVVVDGLTANTAFRGLYTLKRNFALVVCRVGPGGVRPGKIAPTSTDRGAPTTAQRRKLRTDCGPVIRWCWSVGFGRARGPPLPAVPGLPWPHLAGGVRLDRARASLLFDLIGHARETWRHLLSSVEQIDQAHEVDSASMLEPLRTQFDEAHAQGRRWSDTNTPLRTSRIQSISLGTPQPTLHRFWARWSRHRPVAEL